MGNIFFIRRTYNHRSYTNNLSKRRVSRINALDEVDNNIAVQVTTTIEQHDYRPHDKENEDTKNL